MLGDLQILRRRHAALPDGTTGTVWFKTAFEFEYFNDPERTAEVTSADGSMTTVGDMGYLDDDGYLYLTDRATFMIVSGGVNIYPQECENLLIHPSQGRRCGGVWRAESGIRRRSEGGRATDAAT